ncbi:MAG: addiction module protein [Pontiellaceae bacterium]|nr:addiction module protein [Pontiellaceae bacterium]
MSAVLPLDKMTTQEKLRALEAIWDDLAHTPESIPSPDWQGEELNVREERLAKGLTHFSDWTEAKDRIRGQVR